MIKINGKHYITSIVTINVNVRNEKIITSKIIYHEILY